MDAESKQGKVQLALTSSPVFELVLCNFPIILLAESSKGLYKATYSQKRLERLFLLKVTKKRKAVRDGRFPENKHQLRGTKNMLTQELRLEDYFHTSLSKSMQKLHAGVSARPRCRQLLFPENKECARLGEEVTKNEALLDSVTMKKSYKGFKNVSILFYQLSHLLFGRLPRCSRLEMPHHSQSKTALKTRRVQECLANSRARAPSGGLTRSYANVSTCQTPFSDVLLPRRRHRQT